MRTNLKNKTHSVSTMGFELLSSKVWDLYKSYDLQITCFPRRDICLLGKKIKSPLDAASANTRLTTSRMTDLLDLSSFEAHNADKSLRSSKCDLTIPSCLGGSSYQPFIQS